MQQLNSFGEKGFAEPVCASNIAAGPIETCDKASRHRISRSHEHDGGR
jgi:hypothetical protein